MTIGYAPRPGAGRRLTTESQTSVRNSGGAHSAGLRNNEFFSIHIKHIPTKQTVSFEGWITQFSDTYTAQWNEQKVYGRMDPLATYEGTGRQIQLSFDIPNDSKMNATANMQKIQQFIKFMYPVYNDGSESVQNVLTAAPLLTLKWTNLISSPNNEGQELVGYINGPISYAPDVSQGGFMQSEVTKWSLDDKGAKLTGKKLEEKPHGKGIRNYFPKKISMSFSFTVLHTHLVGWYPGEVIEDWGGAPQELIDHVKATGGKPHKTTQTYIFGNKEVNDRFPNIYKALPPTGRGPRGEEQLQADAAAAEDILRAADALSPADQRRADEMDVDALLKRDRDRAAYDRQMLDPQGHGGPAAKQEAEWDTATSGMGPED